MQYLISYFHIFYCVDLEIAFATYCFLLLLCLVVPCIFYHFCFDATKLAFSIQVSFYHSTGNKNINMSFSSILFTKFTKRVLIKDFFNQQSYLFI